WSTRLAPVPREPPCPPPADPGLVKEARVSQRRLPVRPDLDQLKRQAKELLRDIHHGRPDALEDLRACHPEPPPPADVRLHDAQLVLARSYQAASWTRLVQAVQVADAIWRDDLETLRRLIT